MGGMKAESHFGQGGHCEIHSYAAFVNCLDDGTKRLLPNGPAPAPSPGPTPPSPSPSPADPRRLVKIALTPVVEAPRKFTVLARLVWRPTRAIVRPRVRRIHLTSS